MNCEHCTSSTLLYHWEQACCRARFLMTQPTKGLRQSWVDRWRKQGDGQLVERVLERLREAHGATSADSPPEGSATEGSALWAAYMLALAERVLPIQSAQVGLWR